MLACNYCLKVENYEGLYQELIILFIKELDYIPCLNCARYLIKAATTLSTTEYSRPLLILSISTYHLTYFHLIKDEKLRQKEILSRYWAISEDQNLTYPTSLRKSVAEQEKRKSSRCFKVLVSAVMGTASFYLERRHLVPLCKIIYSTARNTNPQKLS